MKSTHELSNDIRACSDPVALAGPAFAPPDFPAYLSGLLEAQGRAVKEIIRACYLERSYGYQLFNGTRRPTRVFLLRLALVLGLDEEEAQRMLKLAGKNVLYPRNRHDAAVLYGLTHRLSLEESDELLRDLGEEGLL